MFWEIISEFSITIIGKVTARFLSYFDYCNSIYNQWISLCTISFMFYVLSRLMTGLSPDPECRNFFLIVSMKHVLNNPSKNIVNMVTSDRRDVLITGH